MDDLLKVVLIAAGVAVVGTVGYLGYKEFIADDSADTEPKPHDNADLDGAAKPAAVSDAAPALTL